MRGEIPGIRTAERVDEKTLKESREALQQAADFSSCSPTPSSQDSAMRKLEYDRKVAQLKKHAGRLIGAIESQLENDSPGDFDGGTTFRNHRLETVAKVIDDVLASFDALQKGLGLDPGDEPRHRKFLKGR
jgi:hypothetical protein